MDRTLRTDAADVLAGIGRHWGWALAFGIVTLLALLGVLSFIVGLYALRHILLTIASLALLLGIFWIVNGAVETFTGLSHRGMQGRAWTVVMGLLSTVAGVVVLAYPGISLATLVVVLGVWLPVLGAMEIVLAFRLRSVGHAAARIAPAT
jgi:uncharacterized membrane protein HdeD (DUF308 family)